MFEINLVPDLKVAVLKSQRVRNIVFIVCVFTMIAVGVVVSTLFTIKSVQDGRLSEQKVLIEKMSQKINDYKDLNNYLTIQGQLNKLGEMEKTKIDYSRFFGFVDILASGVNHANYEEDDDEEELDKQDETDVNKLEAITFSNMTFNVGQNSVSFTGEADDKSGKDIDYNTLETFKKSVPMLKFDYGTYRNENDIAIPSVCILEVDEKGNVLKDETGDLYAIWTKGVSGCDPEDKGEEIMNENGEGTGEYEKTDVVDIKEEDVKELFERKKDDMEDDDEDENEDLVKIWRTPQFEEWYGRENEEDNHMNDNGEIYGIAHFDSECITYNVVNGRWVETNICNLVAGDVVISSSSNGKKNGSLVVTFSASLNYNPEAMLYIHKHIAFISPTGYMNVTDSNIQLKDLFDGPALVCDKATDPDCVIHNEGGEK